MKRSQLKVDALYYVSDSECYAVTPDGVGVYWYDTLAEVAEAYGDDFATSPRRYVARLED